MIEAGKDKYEAEGLRPAPGDEVSRRAGAERRMADAESARRESVCKLQTLVGQIPGEIGNILIN